MLISTPVAARSLLRGDGNAGKRAAPVKQDFLKRQDDQRSNHGPDGVAHVQAHLHTVPGVGGDGVGQTRYAVVAVAQDLDAKTPVDLGDVVESAEELVEHGDQLLGRAATRQLGEAHDVRVQDAAQNPDLHTSGSGDTAEDGHQRLHLIVGTFDFWGSSPDVTVLAHVEAVEVVGVAFVLLLAFGLEELVDDLGFQLPGDVARQHRQEEQLLLPGDTRMRDEFSRPFKLARWISLTICSRGL